MIVVYDPVVTGVSLPACKEVNVNWSGYIDATVYLESAPNKTVYWKSSNPNKPISSSAYTPQLKTEYSYETKAVPVPEPAYNYAFANSWTLGNANIQGVALVAGAVALVVAVILLPTYCHWRFSIYMI